MQVVLNFLFVSTISRVMKVNSFKILRLFRGDVQIKDKPFLLSTYDFVLPKYFDEIHRYDGNIQNEETLEMKSYISCIRSS
jgi:hypothetical protein